MNRALQLVLILSSLVFAACGSSSSSTSTETGENGAGGETVVVETPPVVRQPPPVAGPVRDVHLPPIVRSTLPNGLEVNTVVSEGLPVAYAQLVIRSGMARDPEQLPGLARFVATLLKEGTTTRSSERLADDVDFMGASLDVAADSDSIRIEMRAPSDQLDAMLTILADVATHPAFAEAEITRTKTREGNRLSLESNDPGTLGRRLFFRLAYGSHPYAHLDFDAATLARMRRADLVSWHRTHFVPSNAFLVVAGNVTAEAVQASSTRAFRAWRGRAVAPLALPEVPARTGRDVYIVHRAGSVQSVIAIGNLTIPRAHPDYIALDVANQILGGSSASRLFMDLRERRSLTYGAYSGVDDMVGVSPFRARAAVPNARTELAMDAFMEHLQRIVTEEPPAAETQDAERYLSDSFPLQIETIGRVAYMVAYLRIFNLPDDYWDSYRTQIRSVTPAQALAAARAHIRPDTGIVVVVGDADVVAEPLARWGTVHIVDTDGNATTLEAIRAATATPAQ